MLRQGEINLFEALFGALSGLKATRLQSVLYDSGGEGLAIACRAIEMPKPTFATIFLLSRRGRPGKQDVDPRELSHALLLFDKMNPNAAGEVMKGWRRDWRYQDAIERAAEPAEEPPTEGQETD